MIATTEVRPFSFEEPSAATSERPQTAQRLAAPPARREALSPFVVWSADERAPISDELLHNAAGRSFLVDLVREPRALACRLLDSQARERLVMMTLGLLAAGVATFSAAVMVGRGYGGAGRSAIMAPLNILIAVAAALTPTYAAGILLATRLPIGRLVATLLVAEATGALLLAALAPLEYVVWRTDFNFWGPAALALGFLAAGLATATQLWRVLRAMAHEVYRRTMPEGAVLSPADDLRVRRFADLAATILAFTSTLAVWAFDTFISR